MPLFASVDEVVIPPEPETPGGTIELGVGQASATWHAPDGSIWPLTSYKQGWFTLPGVAGLGALPINLRTDDNPRGGATVRHVRRSPRLITWPLEVWGTSHVEYTERWRNLLEAFTQTDEMGPGILEISRPDGSARRIRAYYQDGFDSDLPYATDGRAALTLFCEKPEWYGIPSIVERREYSSGVSDFLDPFPSVGSSQILGDTTLTNPGNVKAWPVWTIKGPASEIVATLETTGESFTLDPSNIGETFAEGDTITIETDPPRIYNQDGDVWAGALNWPSAVLWGLPKGTHEVTFTVSGADVTTSISLEFPPLYRTA